MKKIMQPLLLICISCFFLLNTASAQETGTIKGTVINKSNSEPVIGANVFIKSLKKGGATDPDGNFSIRNVPYGTYTLRITYIGYSNKQKRITVDQPNVNVNITLSRSVASLKDLVVTAYGQQTQKQNLTTATQTIDAEDVKSPGTSNYLQNLSGRVSGMSVQSNNGIGSTTKIVLRGHSSLSGSNQALIVVDGVPYSNVQYNPPNTSHSSGYFGNDFGNTGVDLSSDNIKSVTVLKGSAASALYGSRGSNGAILIQTNKGTPGQKTRVTFSTSGGFSTILRSTFPEYQREYGAGYNTYTQSTAPNPFGSSPKNITTTNFRADASFGPKFDPNEMVYQWDSFYPGSPTYGQKEPYTAAPKGHGPLSFFRTGTNLKNSLQINGGIADEGYYSLGYSQSFKNAQVPNGKLNENHVNLSAGYNVSSKLEAEGQFSYIRYHSSALPQTGYSTYINNFRQWVQTNVDYQKQKTAYFITHTNTSWNPNAIDVPRPLYWDNPYFEQYVSIPTSDRNRYRGQISLKYDLTDWFTLTARAAADNIQAEIQRRLGGPRAFPPVGSYDRYDADNKEYNFYLLGNYQKQISQKWNVHGVVAGQVRRNITNDIDAHTRGGLIKPGLFSLQNSKNTIPFPDETYEILGVNSIYASFNATYNDFINLSLTGRRDKSSSLPKDNNVYYYPSAAASFTFTHFIQSDILSLGKIRGSYASVGHSAPPLSLRNTYIRSNFGTSATYSLPARRNNPNLLPEKKKSWEIGLELGFFNDRIVLTGDYYKNNSLNETVPVPTSTASGFASQYVNAGNIQNTGIELSLDARPVVGKNFSWKINVNWARNRNKVKSLASGVYYYLFATTHAGVQIGATAPNPNNPDQPAEYGTIRGTDFIYKNGKRVVDPKTGLYEVTDSKNNIIGSVQPNWTGGISNTFNYKNFSLNFLVDVRAGGDIFSEDMWNAEGNGILPSTVGNNSLGNPKRDPVYKRQENNPNAFERDDDGNKILLPKDKRGGVILPGVNPDGSPNTTFANYYQSLGYHSNPEARYVYDGSYVKLRQVGLSYNIPKNFLNKSGIITGATFSVVGRNLWIIHKNLPYDDPESTLTNPNIQGGYISSTMPTLRNVTFEIKLQF